MNTGLLLMSDRNISASPLMLNTHFLPLLILINQTDCAHPGTVSCSDTCISDCRDIRFKQTSFWIQRVRISWTWSLPQEFWPRDTSSCDTSALCVIPSLFRILLWRHQWLEQRNNNCWRMGSSEFHSWSLGKLNKPYMHLLWLCFLKLYV